MALFRRQIRERTRHFIQMRLHKFAVGLALEQPAGDGHDLGAGDVLLRAEGAVRVARDPAARGSEIDILRAPVAVGHVGERCLARSQFFRAAGNGSKLGARDGRVRTERAVGIAGQNLELFKIADVVGIPLAGRNIRE